MAALKLQRLVKDCPLPRNLHHLALVLAWHAKETGDDIFPMVETLCGSLGTPRPHRTSVIRWLRLLRGLGVLEVTDASAGRHRPNFYRMRQDVLEALITGSTPATCEAEHVAPLLPVERGTGSTAATSRVAPLLPIRSKVRAGTGKSPRGEEEAVGATAPAAPSHLGPRSEPPPEDDGTEIEP